MSDSNLSRAIRWFGLWLGLIPLGAAQSEVPGAFLEPIFIEVGSGGWAGYPVSAGLVDARDSRLLLSSNDRRRSIELRFPQSWSATGGDPILARIRRIDAEGARALDAVRSVRFGPMEAEARVGVDLSRFGVATLRWSREVQSAEIQATLELRGFGPTEATEFFNRLAADAPSEGVRWTRVDDSHAQLTLTPSSAESGPPVLIQPLVFGTFLGGPRSEGLRSLAMAADGTLLATGGSNSLEFPSVPGAFDPVGDLATDGVLLGLSDDGSTLEFATFFGGSARDNGRDLVVDTDGTLLVSGLSESSDFPTTPGAFDESWNGDDFTPFVARFNADGSELLAATYIGGSESFGEDIQTLAVDPADGSVVIAGWTANPAWPTTPGTLVSSPPGGDDGFVSRLSADLSTLVASTLIGNAGNDEPVRATVAADGSVLIFSATESLLPIGIPMTLEGRGAFPDATQDNQGYLAKLDPGLDAVQWATWVPAGVHLHPRPDGSFVLVGGTTDSEFPTTPGAYSTDFLGTPGQDSAYVACSISGDGQQLLWSTFVASQGLLFGIRSSAVDNEGRVYFCSAISTLSYPLTPDAVDTEFTGLSEAQISVLDPVGSELLYASLLGVGELSNNTEIYLTPDNCGGAFVTMQASGQAFPTTPGAFDETHNGNGDAWIVRVTAVNPWTHLGGWLPGVKGRPLLGAAGPLCEGDPTAIELSDGPDFGTAFLVLGFSELSAPFKGGVLIPAPDLVRTLTLDAEGARTLAFTWPAQAPSGTQLWLQAWLPDVAAVAGFSASNGVLATTP